MVPRGGLHKNSRINDLWKGATAKASTQSLSFLARVSHFALVFGAADAQADGALRRQACVRLWAGVDASEKISPEESPTLGKFCTASGP